MKKISILFVVVLVIVIISCSKKTTPSDSGKVTTEPTITYALNIQPLILSKCSPCHIPANGGFKTAMDNYDAAKQHIDNIISRVQLTPGEKGYMPFKKTPLAPEEIAMFKKWKEEGMAQ